MPTADEIARTVAVGASLRMRFERFAVDAPNVARVAMILDALYRLSYNSVERDVPLIHLLVGVRTGQARPSGGTTEQDLIWTVNGFFWEPEKPTDSLDRLFLIARPPGGGLTRLRAGSPLELLYSLSPEYMELGAAAWLFVRAIENLWHAPGRVRVEGARLSAAEAEHYANEMEHLLRAGRAAEELERLGSNRVQAPGEGGLTEAVLHLEDS